MSVEGFLFKQGEKGIKTWKRRWFVIRTGNGVPGRRPHLYYYDKTSELKEKGRIDLEQVVEVAECTDGPKEFYEFGLTTPKRFYRLRASAHDEMERWINAIKSYQSNDPPKIITGSSFSEKRKSIKLPAFTSMRSFPKSKDNNDSQNRPTSVTEDFNVSLVKSLGDDNSNNSSQQQSNIRPPSIVTNADQVRQNIINMRAASLQQNESSFPSNQDDITDTPVTQPSWEAQEDSKELQTARKRLAKAQKLNSKYENDIRILRDQVVTLTRENKELHEKIDKRENTVDYDQKRREEELEDYKDKLIVERKLREELNLQYQDTRNELRKLKESIHISRTAPNIYALATKSDSTLSSNINIDNNKPNDNNNTINNTVNTAPISSIKPTLAHSQSVVFPSSSIRTSERRLSVGGISSSNKTNNSNSHRVPWVPDGDCNHCIKCKTEFSLFTRKHHCRNCGLIFCHSCSSKVYPVPGYNGPQRVCDKCFESIRSSKRANKRANLESNINKSVPQQQNTTITNQVQNTYEGDPPVQELDLDF